MTPDTIPLSDTARQLLELLSPGDYWIADLTRALFGRVRTDTRDKTIRAVRELCTRLGWGLALSDRPVPNHGYRVHVQESLWPGLSARAKEIAR